jgi:hypothetical protein
MTGTREYSDDARAAPSRGWRRTMASAYPETMTVVSFKVSPFLTEDAPGSENPNTPPPSRCMAASKEKRVRVEGS